jgi:peptide-methionine (S)-S-oxide reductase
MLRKMMAGIAFAAGFTATAVFANVPTAEDGYEIATFAAGCYWCVESDFDKVKGVVDTTPGFMGGHTKNPTYRQVSTGTTGHAESVNITFDPKVVSYKELLNYYWRHVDFTDKDGQFCDRGSQYRPAIFYYTPEQKAEAEASKAAIAKKFKQPIVVEINKVSDFTPAPDPNFYQTNPLRYKYYRIGCGRDARIDSLWSSVGQ